MYSRSAFDFRFSEAPFEWTSDNLESLRLCRNRAYHKVNSKRRQHLPASISSYLLKEWQAMRPDAPKMDGKQLLAAYNENFEQVGGKYPNASINAKGRASRNPLAMPCGFRDRHRVRIWPEINICITV